MGLLKKEEKRIEKRSRRVYVFYFHVLRVRFSGTLFQTCSLRVAPCDTAPGCLYTTNNTGVGLFIINDS